MSKFILLWALLCWATFAQGANSLFIDDPESLKSLEASGLDFSRWVLGTQSRIETTLKLSENPMYDSIAKDLSSELNAIARRDPSLSVTMASGHRLFDKKWLTSNKATFELVGIVNRLDRRPFLDANTCGEIRFIYRLAYRTSPPKEIYSRLPLTLNAVFLSRKGAENCATTAKSWRAGHSSDTISLREHFSIARLKSVEVNMQAVRWPSTIRPDMGGYAEYLMKVYELEGSKFASSKMENMLDVDALSKQPRLKREFIKWLEQPDVLKAIDRGTALVPPTLLATRAVSVALSGNHRLANAPYSQVFTEADFSHLDLRSLSTIKSAHGLLRRLNDLSCVGCHQGRTVAGFHFLGRDRRETDEVNSIHVGSSPHFITDQPRRLRYFDAVLENRVPEDFRDLSVRAPEDRGLMGSHCGLGDASFARWTCATDLKCLDIANDSRVSQTGICMPKKPRAGSICQVGAIKHHTNPHKDRIKLASRQSCGSEMHCEDVSVGFPSGMCSSSDCKNLAEGETCGSIAVLHGFNACLAEGKRSFSECLSSNVRPGKLQACSSTQHCRDDFICARVGQRGGCIPPYFLFQLRVDGHPKP